MEGKHIVFVGAGNMARSIIGGLVAQGKNADELAACDPNAGQLEALANDFGVRVSTDNKEMVCSADVVVLAVKPQVMKQVCQPLRESIPSGAVVISIAAGINCASLQRWLGPDRALVRCMPNTPSLVQCGASGLFASPEVSGSQKQLAQGIMEAVGIALWLDEEAAIDPVTAVSGSGPAYFFLMLEAMVDAGEAQGLSREVASDLAIQTAAGAAKLAQESDVDLAELRRRVTSPGGTTEQAILSFEKNGFRQIIASAMQSCGDRSKEMAKELGESE